MIQTATMTGKNPPFSLENLFQEFDLNAFQIASEEYAGIPFDELMGFLLKGDISNLGKTLLDYLESLFMNSFGNIARSGMELFLFVIVSSVFAAFASTVSNEGVNRSVRLILYLLFFSASCMLLKEYIDSATEYLHRTLELVQLLFPAWMIAVSALSGVLTLQASYAIGYFCILMLEKGIASIFPVIIYGYALIRFTGNIQNQDFLSSFGDLIKKGYLGILKGVLICVTGVQFLQNLFLPFLDGLSKNAAGKVLSGLPGLGQGVETTIQMTYSALSLIKNSLGAVVILIIVIATFEPAVRFFMFFLLYQLGIALFQPIADKQMLNGLQIMSDCCLLILKTILMVAFLFLLMISLICSATNITHYIA